MSDYIKYKNKRDFPAELKDIMRLTAEEFESGVSAYQPPESEKKNRGRSREVYEDDNVRVVVPEDEAAACYYGQGTRWCTAATRGPNMFDMYNRNGPMYILLPKDPGHEGEKYQLHFATNQFMDENDHPVNIVDLLERRFPELLNLFIELEPKIQNLIVFAPETLVMKISEFIGDVIQERAWETVDEWQSNDDYYHQELETRARELGYLLDKDGNSVKNADDLDSFDRANFDVDWDRVWDDPKLGDYLEYNDEARRYMRDVRKIINSSHREILDAAQSYQHESESNPEDDVTVGQLPEILAYMIDEEIGNDGHDLIEFLTQRVHVQSKNSKHQYNQKTDGPKIGEYDDWYVSIVPKRR
jgi:hypothetical protein